MGEARRQGAPVPYSANTPYLNTIPPDRSRRTRATGRIEHKIRSYIRWNALAIVLRANKESSSSAATSRASSPRPCSTTPASCISGTRPRPSMAAT